MEARRLESDIPVVITMTSAEAAVLLEVCGWIGGVHTGGRGIMKNLSTVLTNAGIEANTDCYQSGNIYLK